MFHASHPDDDVLEQYAMASLPEGAAASIEEHLLVCAACQDRVEAAETYVRSMKSAMASSANASLANRWFPMPALMGMAAVLLLGIGAVVGSKYFGSAADPVAVVLTATRGETASIAAKGAIQLKLDARDLAPGSVYRVRIVNAEGADVWDQAAAGVEDGYVRILVKKHLGRGQYFVRLLPNDAGMPREYSLQVR